MFIIFILWQFFLPARTRMGTGWDRELKVSGYLSIYLCMSALEEAGLWQCCHASLVAEVGTTTQLDCAQPLPLLSMLHVTNFTCHEFCLKGWEYTACGIFGFGIRAPDNMYSTNQTQTQIKSHVYMFDYLSSH